MCRLADPHGQKVASCDSSDGSARMRRQGRKGLGALHQGGGIRSLFDLTVPVVLPIG